MKQLLALSCVLAMAASFASAGSTILHQDDFNGYSSGDSMLDHGWSRVYGGDSDGFCTVEDDGTGNKYVHMKGSSLWGVHIPCDSVGGHSSSNNYKISFKVMRPNKNGGEIICGNNSGYGENHFVNKNGGDGLSFKADAITPSFEFPNQVDYGTWTEFSMNFNTEPGNPRMHEIVFNGDTRTKLNAVMASGTATQDKFENLRFFIWGGNAELCIDDLKMELVDRPKNSVLNVTGTDIYKLDNTDPIQQVASISVADTQVEVEIESEDNWLSFDDDSYAKTLDLKVGTPQTLTFKATVDRTIPGMPAAKVTYSYNDGSEDLKVYKYVYLQCGNDKDGYVLASSNFEEYEEGTVLKTAGTMWNDSDTMATVEEDPSDPVNQCAHLGGTGQFHMRLNMPATSYPDYDIRYSMKIRKCPDTEVNTYVGTWGNNVGEHYVNLFNNGNFQFKGWCDDNNKFITPNCLDKWVDLTFTFALGNKGEGRDALLKHVRVDGVDQRVDIPKYIDSNDTNFTYLRFFNWNHAYIDDLEVSLVPAGEIPEPAILGLLALVGLFLRRK